MGGKEEFLFNPKKPIPVIFTAAQIIAWTKTVKLRTNLVIYKINLVF